MPVGGNCDEKDPADPNNGDTSNALNGETKSVVDTLRNDLMEIGVPSATSNLLDASYAMSSEEKQLMLMTYVFTAFKRQIRIAQRSSKKQKNRTHRKKLPTKPMSLASKMGVRMAVKMFLMLVREARPSLVGDVLDLIGDTLSITSPLSLIDGPNFNPGLVEQIEPLINFVKDSLVADDCDSAIITSDDTADAVAETKTKSSANGQNRVRATQILFGAALARGSLPEVLSLVELMVDKSTGFAVGPYLHKLSLMTVKEIKSAMEATRENGEKEKRKASTDSTTSSTTTDGDSKTNPASTDSPHRSLANAFDSEEEEDDDENVTFPALRAFVRSSSTSSTAVRTFSWDPTLRNSSVTLHDDNARAVSTGYGYKRLGGDEVWEPNTGIHQFDVKVINSNTTHVFYVGIVSDNAAVDWSRDAHMGHEGHCLEISTCKKVKNGNFTVYGSKRTFTPGGIITVVYDSDSGDLSFKWMGEDMGVAFSGLNAQGQRAMVSMKEASEIQLMGDLVDARSRGGVGIAYDYFAMLSDDDEEEDRGVVTTDEAGAPTDTAGVAHAELIYRAESLSSLVDDADIDTTCLSGQMQQFALYHESKQDRSFPTSMPAIMKQYGLPRKSYNDTTALISGISASTVLIANIMRLSYSFGPHSNRGVNTNPELHVPLCVDVSAKTIKALYSLLARLSKGYFDASSAGCPDDVFKEHMIIIYALLKILQVHLHNFVSAKLDQSEVGLLDTDIHDLRKLVLKLMEAPCAARRNLDGIVEAVSTSIQRAAAEVFSDAFEYFYCTINHKLSFVEELVSRKNRAMISNSLSADEQINTAVNYDVLAGSDLSSGELDAYRLLMSRLASFKTGIDVMKEVEANNAETICKFLATMMEAVYLKSAQSMRNEGSLSSPFAGADSKEKEVKVNVDASDEQEDESLDLIANIQKHLFSAAFQKLKTIYKNSKQHAVKNRKKAAGSIPIVPSLPTNDVTSANTNLVNTTIANVDDDLALTQSSSLAATSISTQDDTLFRLLEQYISIQLKYATELVNLAHKTVTNSKNDRDTYKRVGLALENSIVCRLTRHLVACLSLMTSSSPLIQGRRGPLAPFRSILAHVKQVASFTQAMDSLSSLVQKQSAEYPSDVWSKEKRKVVESAHPYVNKSVERKVHFPGATLIKAKLDARCGTASSATAGDAADAVQLFSPPAFTADGESAQVPLTGKMGGPKGSPSWVTTTLAIDGDSVVVAFNGQNAWSNRGTQPKSTQHWGYRITFTCVVPIKPMEWVKNLTLRSSVLVGCMSARLVVGPPLHATEKLLREVGDVKDPQSQSSVLANIFNGGLMPTRLDSASGSPTAHVDFDDEFLHHVGDLNKCINNVGNDTNNNVASQTNIQQFLTDLVTNRMEIEHKSGEQEKELTLAGKFVAKMNKAVRIRIHIQRSIKDKASELTHLVVAVLVLHTNQSAKAYAFAADDELTEPSENIEDMWRRAFNTRRSLKTIKGNDEGITVDEFMEIARKRASAMIQLGAASVAAAPGDSSFSLHSDEDDLSLTTSLSDSAGAAMPKVSLTRKLSASSRWMKAKAATKLLATGFGAAKRLQKMLSAQRQRSILLSSSHVDELMMKKLVDSIINYEVRSTASNVVEDVTRELRDIVRGLRLQRKRALYRMVGLIQFNFLTQKSVVSNADVVNQILTQMALAFRYLQSENDVLANEKLDEKRSEKKKKKEKGKKVSEVTLPFEWMKAVNIFSVCPSYRSAMNSCFFDTAATLMARDDLNDKSRMQLLAITGADLKSEHVPFLSNIGFIKFLTPWIAFNGVSPQYLEKLVESSSSTSPDEGLTDTLSIQQALDNVTTSAQSQNLTWNVRFSAWTFFRVMAYIGTTKMVEDDKFQEQLGGCVLQQLTLLSDLYSHINLRSDATDADNERKGEGTDNDEKEWDRRASNAHLNAVSTAYYMFELNNDVAGSVSSAVAPSYVQLELYASQFLWLILRCVIQSEKLVSIISEEDWLKVLFRLLRSSATGGTGSGNILRTLVFRILRRILPELAPQNQALQSKAVIGSDKDLVAYLLSDTGKRSFPWCLVLNGGMGGDGSAASAQPGVEGLKNLENVELDSARESVSLLRSMLNTPMWGHEVNQAVQAEVSQLSTVRAVLTQLQAGLLKNSAAGPASDGDTDVAASLSKLEHIFAALSVLGGHLEPLGEGSNVTVSADGDLTTGILTKMVVGDDKKCKRIQLSTGSVYAASNDGVEFHIEANHDIDLYSFTVSFVDDASSIHLDGKCTAYLCSGSLDEAIGNPELFKEIGSLDLAEVNSISSDRTNAVDPAGKVAKLVLSSPVPIQANTKYGIRLFCDNGPFMRVGAFCSVGDTTVVDAALSVTAFSCLSAPGPNATSNLVGHFLGKISYKRASDKRTGNEIKTFSITTTDGEKITTTDIKSIQQVPGITLSLDALRDKRTIIQHLCEFLDQDVTTLLPPPVSLPLSSSTAAAAASSPSVEGMEYILMQLRRRCVSVLSTLLDDSESLADLVELGFGHLFSNIVLTPEEPRPSSLALPRTRIRDLQVRILDLLNAEVNKVAEKAIASRSSLNAMSDLLTKKITLERAASKIHDGIDDDEPDWFLGNVVSVNGDHINDSDASSSSQPPFPEHCFFVGDKKNYFQPQGSNLCLPEYITKATKMWKNVFYESANIRSNNSLEAASIGKVTKFGDIVEEKNRVANWIHHSLGGWTVIRSCGDNTPIFTRVRLKMDRTLKPKAGDAAFKFMCPDSVGTITREGTHITTSGGGYKRINSDAAWMPNTGVYEYTIKLHRGNSSLVFYFGIAPTTISDFTTNSHMGHVGWCYETSTGKKVKNSSFTPYGTKTAVTAGDTMKCIYDSHKGTVSFVIRGVAKGEAFSGIDVPVKPMLSMKESSCVELMSTSGSGDSKTDIDVDLTSLDTKSSPEIILSHPFTYSALLTYVYEKERGAWSILKFREQIRFFNKLQLQSELEYSPAERWRDTRIILDNMTQTITRPDPTSQLDAQTTALRKAYPYSQQLANQRKVRNLIKEARKELKSSVEGKECGSLEKLFVPLLAELDAGVLTSVMNFKKSREFAMMVDRYKRALETSQDRRCVTDFSKGPQNDLVDNGVDSVGANDHKSKESKDHDSRSAGGSYVNGCLIAAGPDDEGGLVTGYSTSQGLKFPVRTSKLSVSPTEFVDGNEKKDMHTKASDVKTVSYSLSTEFNFSEHYLMDGDVKETDHAGIDLEKEAKWKEAHKEHNLLHLRHDGQHGKRNVSAGVSLAIDDTSFRQDGVKGDGKRKFTLTVSDGTNSFTESVQVLLAKPNVVKVQTVALRFLKTQTYLAGGFSTNEMRTEEDITEHTKFRVITYADKTIALSSLVPSAKNPFVKAASCAGSRCISSNTVSAREKWAKSDLADDGTFVLYNADANSYIGVSKANVDCVSPASCASRLKIEVLAETEVPLVYLSSAGHYLSMQAKSLRVMPHPHQWENSLWYVLLTSNNSSSGDINDDDDDVEGDNPAVSFFNNECQQFLGCDVSGAVNTSLTPSTYNSFQKRADNKYVFRRTTRSSNSDDVLSINDGRAVYRAATSDLPGFSITPSYKGGWHQAGIIVHGCFDAANDGGSSDGLDASSVSAVAGDNAIRVCINGNVVMSVGMQELEAKDVDVKKALAGLSSPLPLSSTPSSTSASSSSVEVGSGFTGLIRSSAYWLQALSPQQMKRFRSKDASFVIDKYRCDTNYSSHVPIIHDFDGRTVTLPATISLQPEGGVNGARKERKVALSSCSTPSSELSPPAIARVPSLKNNVPCLTVPNDMCLQMQISPNDQMLKNLSAETSIFANIDGKMMQKHSGKYDEYSILMDVNLTALPPKGQKLPLLRLRKNSDAAMTNARKKCKSCSHIKPLPSSSLYVSDSGHISIEGERGDGIPTLESTNEMKDRMNNLALITAKTPRLVGVLNPSSVGCHKGLYFSLEAKDDIVVVGLNTQSCTCGSITSRPVEVYVSDGDLSEVMNDPTQWTKVADGVLKRTGWKSHCVDLDPVMCRAGERKNFYLMCNSDGMVYGGTPVAGETQDSSRFTIYPGNCSYSKFSPEHSKYLFRGDIFYHVVPRNLPSSLTRAPSVEESPLTAALPEVAETKKRRSTGFFNSLANFFSSNDDDDDEKREKEKPVMSSVKSVLKNTGVKSLDILDIPSHPGVMFDVEAKDTSVYVTEMHFKMSTKHCTVPASSSTPPKVPTSPTPPAPSIPAKPVLARNVSRSNLPVQDWACGACTFINNAPYLLAVCNMCDTPAPATAFVAAVVSPPPAPTLPVPTPAPADASVKGSIVGPTKHNVSVYVVDGNSAGAATSDWHMVGSGSVIVDPEKIQSDAFVLKLDAPVCITAQTSKGFLLHSESGHVLLAVHDEKKCPDGSALMSFKDENINIYVGKATTSQDDPLSLEVGEYHHLSFGSGVSYHLSLTSSTDANADEVAADDGYQCRKCTKAAARALALASMTETETEEESKERGFRDALALPTQAWTRVLINVNNNGMRVYANGKLVCHAVQHHYDEHYKSADNDPKTNRLTPYKFLLGSEYRLFGGIGTGVRDDKTDADSKSTDTSGVALESDAPEAASSSSSSNTSFFQIKHLQTRLHSLEETEIEKLGVCVNAAGTWNAIPSGHSAGDVATLMQLMRKLGFGQKFAKLSLEVNRYDVNKAIAYLRSKVGMAELRRLHEEQRYAKMAMSLSGLGAPLKLCAEALERTGGDNLRAIRYLLQHPDVVGAPQSSSPPYAAPASSNNDSKTARGSIGDEKSSTGNNTGDTNASIEWASELQPSAHPWFTVLPHANAPMHSTGLRTTDTNNTDSSSATTSDSADGLSALQLASTSTSSSSASSTGGNAKKKASLRNKRRVKELETIIKASNTERYRALKTTEDYLTRLLSKKCLMTLLQRWHSQKSDDLKSEGDVFQSLGSTPEKPFLPRFLRVVLFTRDTQQLSILKTTIQKLMTLECKRIDGKLAACPASPLSVPALQALCPMSTQLVSELILNLINLSIQKTLGQSVTATNEIEALDVSLHPSSILVAWMLDLFVNYVSRYQKRRREERGVSKKAFRHMCRLLFSKPLVNLILDSVFKQNGDNRDRFCRFAIFIATHLEDEKQSFFSSQKREGLKQLMAKLYTDFGGSSLRSDTYKPGSLKVTSFFQALIELNIVLSKTAEKKTELLSYKELFAIGTGVKMEKDPWKDIDNMLKLMHAFSSSSSPPTRDDSKDSDGKDKKERETKHNGSDNGKDIAGGLRSLPTGFALQLWFGFLKDCPDSGDLYAAYREDADNRRKNMEGAESDAKKDEAASLSKASTPAARQSMMDAYKQKARERQHQYCMDEVRGFNEGCDQLGADIGYENVREFNAELVDACRKYEQKGSESILRVKVTEFSLDSKLLSAYKHLPNAQPDQVQFYLYLLLQLNKLVTKYIDMVDLSLSPGVSILSDAVSKIKHLIFFSTKQKLLTAALSATANASYDGHSGLTHLSLNRFRSFGLLQEGRCDERGKYSIFGQVFRKTRGEDFFRCTKGGRAFKANFEGEASEDAGGPYRGCISFMADELQSCRLPLFLKCPNGKASVGMNRGKWIPSPAATKPVHISMYEFLGKLFGLAIRTGTLMSMDLPSIMYKQLVNEQPTSADVLAHDILSFKILNEYDSLMKMGNTSAAQTVFEDFEQCFDLIGSDGKSYELFPGGSKVAVTFNRIKEYINRCRAYRVNEFKVQSEAIRRGLATVVPHQVLSLLTWEELELLICGTPKMDIELFKRNTTYGSGVAATDNHIQLFWQCVSKMTDDERAKLVRFVWGRSRLPLDDAGFTQKFKIAPYHGSLASLPVSHTCFFTLDLPRYESVDVMYQKLVYAITNCIAVDGDGAINHGALDINVPSDSDSESDDY